eukprot:scaffold306984_cov31-Prasinocladus_malaysianus.AAC.2
MALAMVCTAVEPEHGAAAKTKGGTGVADCPDGPLLSLKESYRPARVETPMRRTPEETFSGNGINAMKHMRARN